MHQLEHKGAETVSGTRAVQHCRPLFQPWPPAAGSTVQPWGGLSSQYSTATEKAAGNHRPGLHVLCSFLSTASTAWPCLPGTSALRSHAPMQAGPPSSTAGPPSSAVSHRPQPLATGKRGREPQQACLFCQLQLAAAVPPVHYPVIDCPNLVRPAQLPILLAVLGTQLVSNLQKRNSGNVHTLAFPHHTLHICRSPYSCPPPQPSFLPECPN